jgi:CheY-like chemotaxis protein
MRTQLDHVINLLGDYRDYVLLALAVLVLVEGAIIVLWARRNVQLGRRLDAAIADAERSAAKAAAAVAKVEQVPKTYRVADAARNDSATERTPGRTFTTLPPAPPAAPARVAEPVEAAQAAEAPAADKPAEYTTPVAEKAAAWVLPEVEASRTPDQPPADAPPATGAPTTPPRPLLNWSPEGTATPATPEDDPAPTTLGWSGTSVPVEPAPDFAVITDPDAVGDATPAARTSPASNGNGNGNGNGHGGMHDTVAWATPTVPAPPAGGRPFGSGGATAPSAVWDFAMFDSNDEVDDLPSSDDILLVEDDPTITRLYRVLLESRGYSVRVAADGLEGLDRANEKRPDLVLLDIMMPRMNGIAFLQALRAGTMRTVPVVVLSNFMEKQLVDDALALGALEYMVKAQTRPEALAGALPHWLRGERAFSS